MTSKNDCDECLLSTGHVARTINESTMQITVNHGKCVGNIATFEEVLAKIWKWSQYI